jgi:hypothetical protein
MMHLGVTEIAHKNLVEASATMRAYAGSAASAQAIEMLDALSASYCLDLIHVKPEDLIRTQSALQQVSALRAVFADDGVDIPKI